MDNPRGLKYNESRKSITVRPDAVRKNVYQNIGDRIGYRKEKGIRLCQNSRKKNAD